MAAAYLATSNVDAAIGATERQVLFSDDETTAGYSGTYFTEANEICSEMAKAMAENAGYAPGDTTTDKRLIAATLGLLLLYAYSRKMPADAAAKRIPEPLAIAYTQLRTGDLKLAATPSARAAVGGAEFSDVDDTDGTYEPIFRRDKLSGY